ncbi:glycoside hydrolase family 2 protein [Jiangella asiatica]|uniref:Glycoside hydrolase family 2 protein n=1 Tax=Jiangella asiatica TaxID=2530372 RepID=A0A4R5DS70_9ACTN|nr:glycoside hydrolase family 2 TIM barrel-domain containing protein [Jiangella asiatica]TDE14911.1 glycoside hydrolase family 2 protein [Jiangella asiatica]
MPRHLLDLDRGWRHTAPASPGDEAADLDDSGWERVTLPHSTTTLPWHGFDRAAYQFVSVYRRTVEVPEGFTGRVFLDVDGAMTASTVWCNGVLVGEHLGGYTPFSMELTAQVARDRPNVIAIRVDATERPDIPPFGGRMDYLTFGGIYRDVTLRLVPQVFVADVFAKPVRVLEAERAIEVSCELDADGAVPGPLSIEAELRDGARILARSQREVRVSDRGTATVDLLLENLGDIELWDIDRPRLYDVVVRLHGPSDDEHTRRIGLREARFTPAGFFLNGRRLKLRGLNRHQTFPFVGGAMPRRVQRRDAEILRHELKCNVVRTSHYPQSPHFLDRCDEIGLLVVEEIPGWSHVGDAAWQALACRDVEAMVRRDRNRPSVILWGVRINESRDHHDFYTRTNQLARTLDDSRQTGGIRNFFDSELLEDVYTVNDFDIGELRRPNHQLYLVTEFGGHTFPTKQTDHLDRVQEHVLRHARVLDQIYGDDRHAGGIGWCAFDYNTRGDAGSGDHVCYHGVSDIFRIPKPAAALYRSQCDPAEAIVLEPAFHWSRGEFHPHAVETHNTMYDDRAGHRSSGLAVICSNCDELRLYVGDRMVSRLEPAREAFGHLPHPPFITDALSAKWGPDWHDLCIEGYLEGRLVTTRRLSGRGVDALFQVEPDDTTLVADGSDATRVVLRVTDEFGNRRPYATGAVSLRVEGPARIIGDNPFALVGGGGAVWLRTTETPGPVRLHAEHTALGAATAEIQVLPAGTPSAPSAPQLAPR